ncbi:peptidylprolyl isomerase [Sphingomonas sp. LY160]|uniref:peptidylprolyl isomerase n=1 Tax=Sphingomonas sp. LY160 TaxID=3095342 RepID=UPI002ADEB5FD|nr:SurA N-terminal domain-containing protein [Sphingomonas sp. LY160]MEA1071374.1 SurA N-terminal domain-containing protein [Sphingomonas sp. LY160]
MLSFFRKSSKSTLGTIILVVFLLAIAASFALADISNVRSGPLGGGVGGALAEVGDEEITDRDMTSAMRQALNRLQQQNPEATYADLANDFGAILNSQIDERALLAFAKDQGFVLSKRVVDAEIANIPQTRGLDGKFNQQAYDAFLQQQQMTDADIRRLLNAAIMQRLVLAPAAVEARIPVGVARPYASMLLEQRSGQIALVETDRFRAGLNPTDGDLQSFYAQNSQRYMVPEQRILRMARITPAAVTAAPTDAEIAAYYRANQARYGGAETRVLSQAVVQDKAVAYSIASRARGGAAFAAAAAPAGLSAEDVSVGPQSRADFASLAGDNIAAAAFAAANGAIVGPIRSDLGWHVIRVDEVRAAAGRSLEQARGEISTLLAANKGKEALADTVTKVEEAIADGASFAEATAAARLPVITTPAITGAGAARSDAAYRFPADLAPALKAAFAQEAGDDPEVVSLPGDAGYVLVGVDTVMEAAPAPLAQIRDRVRADWITRKASDRARAVANGIATKVARGSSFQQAIAGAGVALQAAQPISARRLQLSEANPDAVAPLRMLFTLAQGKSRLVADPQGRGYFVVKTDKIVPGNALSNPALIAQTQQAFQQTAADELAQQLLAAMKADQGVRRNEEAITASRQRITGAGN